MAALAVHGVGNRDTDSFERSVAGLAELAGLAPDGLVPVFWGDLGPEGPLLSIPADSDTAVLPDITGAFDVVPADVAAAASATAAATVGRLEALSRESVPADTRRAVTEATEEAAKQGLSLALRPEVVDILAEVVLTAEPAGTATVASGAFGLGSIKDRLLGVLKSVNDALVDLLVREFRGFEAGLGGTIAHTIGDVFVYQSLGPQIRRRIDEAFRRAHDARGDGEVDVVAHSLGALAVVEWLLGATVDDAGGYSPTPSDERRVRHLVTFGAQVSLFSELLGLRRTGDQFGAGPGRQTLAIDVASWTNVWQELDPLAFVMHRVLDVQTPAGSTVTIEDRRLTQKAVPTNLSFHSSYWKDQRFARWLGDHLGG